MSEFALSARDLVRTFRSGKAQLPVLRGANLELNAGETVALQGISGSVKSTLLQLLGLLEPPDQGEIFLEGRRVDHRSAAQQAKLRADNIGFVFQQFQLLPELSALENVLVPRRIVLGWSWWGQAKAERKRALEGLAAVGLYDPDRPGADRSHHRPDQLSGGEQQRVALARALISKPAILLADEPTGNLDRSTGQEVLKLLLGLAAQHRAAVLLATHDAEVAAACHRILVLQDGVLKPAP